MTDITRTKIAKNLFYQREHLEEINRTADENNNCPIKRKTLIYELALIHHILNPEIDDVNIRDIDITDYNYYDLKEILSCVRTFERPTSEKKAKTVDEILHSEAAIGDSERIYLENSEYFDDQRKEKGEKVNCFDDILDTEALKIYIDLCRRIEEYKVSQIVPLLNEIKENWTHKRDNEIDSEIIDELNNALNRGIPRNIERARKDLEELNYTYSSARRDYDNNFYYGK